MPFRAHALQTQKKLEDIKAAAVAAGVPDLNLPINTVVKGALLPRLQLAMATDRSNPHMQQLPWAALQVVEGAWLKEELGHICHAMPCLAWHGIRKPLHGTAWHGVSWQPLHGVAWLGVAWHGMHATPWPRHAMHAAVSSCHAAPCHAAVFSCHAMPWHSAVSLCHAAPCHATPCQAMSCPAAPCHASSAPHSPPLLASPPAVGQFRELVETAERNKALRETLKQVSLPAFHRPV